MYLLDILLVSLLCFVLTLSLPTFDIKQENGVVKEISNWKTHNTSNSYIITEGYISSDQTCLNLSRSVALLEERVCFICGTNKRGVNPFSKTLLSNLLSQNTKNKDGKTFSANTFLHLLRNKRLTIVGDSTGMQTYQALESELVCQESRRYTNADWKPPFPPVNTSNRLEHNYFPNHPYFAWAQYDAYNASIMFCFNNVLDDVQDPVRYRFCTHEAYTTSDVLVFAVGPWWKLESSKSINFTSTERLIEEIRKQGQKVREACVSALQHVHRINPRIKSHDIIWRTIPHQGNIDDLVFLKKVPYEQSWDMMWNPTFWQNSSAEATYVDIFNEVLISVARAHHNIIVDVNNFSHELLDHYSRHNILAHRDAMHWCTGGFDRLSAVLYQDALFSRQQYVNHETTRLNLKNKSVEEDVEH